METEEIKPTEMVFHYTTKEAALEHILPNREIRMGSYTGTNDPRESKSWKPVTYTRSGRGDLWGPGQDGEDKLLDAQRGAKVLCLTLDSEISGEESPVEDRGYGHSRMWTQYAGEHSGVCLGFDSQALQDAIEGSVPNKKHLIKRNIDYIKLSLESRKLVNIYDMDTNQIDALGSEEYIRRHVQKFADTFFFTKAEDWQQEREFRWVYCGTPTDKEILIPIGNALRMVVLGMDFPKSYLYTVNGICDPWKIPISAMDIYRGYFLWGDI